MTPTRPFRFLTRRVGIIAAAAVGFTVGAAGLVAARDDDSPTQVTATAAVDDSSSTTVDDSPSTTVDDSPSTSVDDSPSTSVDDSPSTSVDDSPSTTVGDDATSTTVGDDATSTTVGDDATSTTVGDDATSTTVGDDATSTTVGDDATSTTVDDDATSTTVDDDGGTSTTIASALPDPFSTTYASAGGSISVTWSGSTFTLDAVSPAAGFHAEIEDQAPDRIRVDFEGDDDDHRIEVRINDGQLRVRVD